MQRLCDGLEKQEHQQPSALTLAGEPAPLAAAVLYRMVADKDKGNVNPL